NRCRSPSAAATMAELSPAANCPEKWHDARVESGSELSYHCRTAAGGQKMMAKGYWVAFADVSDPEGYKAYVAENAKAFGKYGARFLARGGQGESPESQTLSRVEMIEFPSYDAAL